MFVCEQGSLIENENEVVKPNKYFLIVFVLFFSVSLHQIVFQIFLQESLHQNLIKVLLSE